MFVRSPYNYDSNEASLRAGCSNSEETRTQQHFKEQCDINRIVKTYAKTGLVPGNTRIPLEEDFYGITDFHTAMNAVRQGEEAFMELPAELRSRFHNDPQEYVEFCLDEENFDELVKMGLAHKPFQLEQPTVEEPVAEGQAQ